MMIPDILRASPAWSLLLPPHLIGRLIFPQSDIDGVSQQIVRGPGQIGDLNDELRLDPMDAR
jgi:hypothetical protein